MAVSTGAPAGSWTALPRPVRVLTLARAVNRLGAFTLPFLTVILASEFEATVAQAGLILTLFGAATIPSRILGGQLADRLGRKRAIVLGLTGCAAAQVWIAVASSLWSVILAVGLLGLVFEIYEPPSQAVIADLTDPEERPAAYGLLGAAMAAAAVAAGLLASWLAHWDLRWLFIIDAATCAISAVLVSLALPSSTPATDPGTSPPVRFAAWRDRKLLLMLASGTVFATLYMQIVVALPLTLIERRLPTWSIGLLLTTSALTLIAGQRLLTIRQLRQIDSFHAVALGYALLGIGILGNGFAGTLPEFLACAILWSLGDLILLGRLYTIVADLAPAEARGRYMATFGLSWGVATTIAPVTATQLIAIGGPAALWTTCAGAALALAAVQPTIGRHIKPATGPEPSL